MGTRLLRHISIFGVGIYILALAVVSLAFRDFALQAKWIFWGVGEVLFFFVLTNVFYPRWKNNDQKLFLRKVFFVALAIRALYAFLICYYYYYQTGIAFGYGAADSFDYHSKAVYLSRCLRNGDSHLVFPFLYKYTMGFSDQGYTLWLTLVYTIFGPNLLTVRLLKSLMGAYLCVLVYKLASRTFSDRVGRLSAVMCVFMPIFVQICGLYIKEMELIFLSIFALERMDYLIRSKKYTVWNIFFPILLTGLAFGFRTVTGMCLIFAFVVFIVLSSSDLVGKKGKIATFVATVVLFFVFLFSPIGYEMRYIFKLNFDGMNYRAKEYKEQGMKHAELASNLVLAPGAFVLPLAPMVEETPDHNKMIHGSTYVKNFIGFFAMLAILFVIRQKKWRDFSLMGAYELAYLAIIMLTFTANSERYHQPAIPIIIIMSAYAMPRLRRKDMRLFYVYCALLFVALLTWNWLKLSARGLV